MQVGGHVLLVERTATGAVVRLIARDGAEPLELQLTDRGAVLRLRAGLTVAFDGDLTLQADAIALQAQKHLALSSEGDVTVTAGGPMRSEARAHEIIATRGDVRVAANDDVLVTGEQIRLNG